MFAKLNRPPNNDSSTSYGHNVSVLRTVRISDGLQALVVFKAFVKL